MFYYFNAEMKYYEKPFAPDPVLNNNSWEDIQKAAQLGIASDTWNVGDRIEIPLNGTCRARTFNNYKVYAYILGFNHNAELEGDNTITFQIGFDALSGGDHIALTDNYGDSYSQGVREFCMNTTKTSRGGWSSSFMRNTVIPAFISCLPSDLQSALKAVTKYTDNAIGNVHQYLADVTATQDKVFLLAEYEVFGARTYANQYEQNKQAQYDYYKNGNSKIMYNDQSIDTVAEGIWWMHRSAYYKTEGYFCRAYNGGPNVDQATYSEGFAPAFVVG